MSCSQGSDLFKKKKKFLKVGCDNASLMIPFSWSPRSHISSTFKIFSIFQNSAVMKQGRRREKKRNQHNESAQRETFPSRSATLRNIKRLRRSSIRRFIWGHVLSPEFIWDLVSAAAVAWWSPRYLECTFRRFIDLKVVEIILMPSVWKSDSVSQPKTCGI